jgi:very-short-patch-repair endonuclease
MSIFTRNIDELLTNHLSTSKQNLTKNLRKNYKENIHYIIDRDKFVSRGNRGGGNRIEIMITDSTFELLKNSYNLRNRYIVEVSDSIKCVNIGMCIENQTVGFIENSFVGSINCKRQYMFGKYRVDLYFPDYKLVVECDENNHDDRNHIQERIRENYITSLGNTFIRYNPNVSSFDLSNVLKEIHIAIFTNIQKNNNITTTGGA